MRPISVLFSAVILLFSHNLSGQIVSSFTPATVNATVGQVVSVDLKMSGFTNIVSMQFSVSWDSTVLKLESVSNSSLSAFMPAPGFNYSLTADPNNPNNVFLQQANWLRVSWNPNLSQFPNGATVPATATILRFNFRVLKACASPVNINPALAPIPEFRNNQGASLSVDFSSGAEIIAGDCPPPPPSFQGLKIISTDMFIPQGEIGCMPIRVNDYQDIVTTLVAFNWNPAVLNFDCVRNFNLPGLTSADFDINQAAGRLAVSWGTPSGNAISRPNLSPIFEVCLKAVGAPGASTSLTPNGNGFPQTTPAEIARPNGQNLWNPNSVPVPGTISIMPNPPSSTAVQYFAERDSVKKGDITCVAIRANKFNSLVISEFAVLFDTTKLSFASINLGANPLGLNNNNVEWKELETAPFSGEFVRFVHFRYDNPAGISLPDSTVLFEVCLNAIGNAGETVPVQVKSFSYPFVTCAGIGAFKSNLSGAQVFTTNGHVHIRPAITINPGSQITQIKCNGGNDGAISLSPTGGTGPYTFNWSGTSIVNPSQQNQTGLMAGTYNVTITDQPSGATSTATFNLFNPPPLTTQAASYTVTHQTCFGANTGAISGVTAQGGTGPYSYAWSGPGGVTYNTPNISALTPGAYNLTVTDANQCQTIAGPVNVNAATQMQVQTGSLNTQNVACFGTNTGSISLNIVGGAANKQFQWSGPGNFTANTEDISNLAAGNYTLMVTDGNGCTFTTQQFTINNPGAPFVIGQATANDVSCINDTNGSITQPASGGWTPYMSFSWTNAQGQTVSNVQNPIGLAPGVYTPTFTDNRGCSVSGAPVTISAPPSQLMASFTATQTACPNQASGSITVTANGGWGAYQYAWGPLPQQLPPVPNPTGVQAGTYSVTVSDAKGCAVVINPVVQGPQPIVANPDVTNLTCHNSGNGGIILNATGGAMPYQSITWTGNLSGGSISNLAAGQYTPTIIDANNCMVTLPPIIVTAPQPITISGALTDPDPGQTNGAIALTVTGGTPNYQYAWIGPDNFTSNQPNISSLKGGIYTVTITDSNLCQEVAEFFLSGGLAASVISTTPSCNNDGCVQLDLTLPGAGIFVLNWTNTATGMSNAQPVLAAGPITVCDLAGGAYTFQLCDDAGLCSPTVNATVQQNQPVTPHGQTVSDPTPPNYNNGQILLTPSQSGQVLSYSWSPTTLPAGPVQLSLTEGTYTVTITNFTSGCTLVLTYALNNQYPALALAHNATNPTCANSNTGSINLNIGGGNPPFTFLWSNGAVTQNISGVPAGDYSVTITQAHGATTVYTVPTLTNQSSLTITNVNILSNYGGFQVSGANKCDGIGEVFFSGQAGPVSVQWSSGGNTAFTQSLCAGDYTVIVTDNLGCTATWNGSLTAPAGITSTALAITNYNGFNVSCDGQCDGVARVQVNGGVLPYNVIWPTGQVDFITSPSMFSQAVKLCGGSYKVTVTDFNNNAAIVDVVITEPDPITATFSFIEPTTFNSCDGEVFIVANGVAGSPSFIWSSAFGRNGTGQNASGLCASDNVQFIVRDANGCIGTFSAEIPFPQDGCLHVRPVITPGNDDGKNDFTFIPCIETVENTVEIYNRWGQLVFRTDNYNNGDSGRRFEGKTRDGALLAEGVYFYVLTYKDIQNRNQQLKGHINLIR
ncbi:MAG: gliding motility-associated C-terminal domain-containing protein [Saprospiraceae bacterium]